MRNIVLVITDGGSSLKHNLTAAALPLRQFPLETDGGTPSGAASVEPAAVSQGILTHSEIKLEGGL